MSLRPLKLRNKTIPIPIIQGGMGVGISWERLAGAVEQILRKAGWESETYRIIPPIHTDVVLDYGESEKKAIKVWRACKLKLRFPILYRKATYAIKHNQ